MISSSMRFINFFAAVCLAVTLFQLPGDAMANELKITTTKEGDGPVAEKGMKVAVHYVGKLEDGTEFDNSRKRGTPIEFVLGSGQVIPGWEQGIEGMKVGEQRDLIIPPELGYGARGAGGAIPPNATLYFAVELMEVRMPASLGQLDSKGLLAAQKDGVVIIDIRRPEEWKETGIIEGAATVTAFDQSGRLMPDFQQKFMSLVPTNDTPFVLYCRSGSRTNMLGRALMEQVGFEDVSHLTGGIIQFEEEGNKLVPLN